MNILFATSEAAPFIKSGGLGDVAYALPLALSKKKGMNVRVILPLYPVIREKYGDKLSQIASFYLPLAWRRVYCGIFEYKENGITYLFVDNAYYFARTTIYGDMDDGERFAFFSKAILEMCNVLDMIPDVIHLNDWQTALVPVLLKSTYCYLEKFNYVKTVFTIHNIEYQGKADESFLADVLGINDYWRGYLHYGDCLNFMVSAIRLADKVTTVSRTYAQEITDPFYAHGLDSLLKEYRYKLSGIVNGIDVELFNSQTDKMIPKNFSLEDMSGKAEDKRLLQEELGLAQKADVPLVGMVTRLVGHKGIDLVEFVLDEMLDMGVQVVILGTGEQKFEQLLCDVAARRPDKLSVKIMFDLGLASRIYAGCDMFLMPSKSEPCGLAQMISMRYGTAPIVRETGGLKDTVVPFNAQTGQGLGFTFVSYNAHDMLGAVGRACEVYHNKDSWHTLQYNMMTNDVSWDKSAQEYLELYSH